MKRQIAFLALVGLLAGLVPMAFAQGPAPAETAAGRLSGATRAPDDAPIDALRILDDFNRDDGPIGPDWTVHDGYCNVLGNAAVCGDNGRATFNGYSGDGNAAEADVQASGTATQYTGLLLNYGAGVSNLFLKVQKQGGAPDQFTHAACYLGNNGDGGSFGLGFFTLDAPFSTAHMKATRDGNDVTLSFTNIDGGTQPNQTYVCSGAPAPEGTGVGIVGYVGIALLDNFAVPTSAPINFDGLLYMTSLDIGDATFAVYDPSTDAWTTLAPYATGCQMAVSAEGKLFAYGAGTGTIDRYNPASDTWTPIMPGPPGASGYFCNLEITNAGEFLYTEVSNNTLWYTSGGVWNTLALPFETNAMGDYDPTTDQYVVGELFTTNAHWIDVHTWAITDFSSALPNGEYARFGVVLGNRYYFEAAGSNVHSFDLSSPADPPLDHGVSPGWYTSAAADRSSSVIYSASIDGTALRLFDPATNSLTPRTGYGHATWHSSLAFVPRPLPAMTAAKKAPAFAQTGEVISYTIVISAPVLASGMFMSDTLPAGVEYAGHLTYSDGNAWYDDVDNAVYWTVPPLASGAPAPARPVVYIPGSEADVIGPSESPAAAPSSPVETWTYPKAVLWDNGPLVTHPGACGGQDASRLQTSLGMGTYGFGHQFSVGYRMADDFEITNPSGWQIDSITFFAYQSASPADPSPITGVYLQIWDGPPWAGGTVVWGDLTTNRLLSSTFSYIQRDSETTNCANNRYIFADVAGVGTNLPPGHYWLDWMTDGSASYSGPWAPPITILGQTTTGDAYQYTTAWAPALDTGTGTQQGMPFVIQGALAEPVRVEIAFRVTVTAACGEVILNEGVAGRGPLVRHFAASTAILGDADIAVTPPALAATLHPDATATQPLEICNAGTCPLHWELYEGLPPLARNSAPFVPVDVTGPALNSDVEAASPPAPPAAVPPSPLADVLWDQPLSTVNQAAFVDQVFPDAPAYSSFLADDFTNAEPWLIERLFIPGDGWNGFSTLLNATALTWQLYADCAGVPCGDPAGGGGPPFWTLTLPPNHPQVVISAGTPGGNPSDVQLTLPMPGVLPPGTWWLVFYPTMTFIPFGQYGRQPADTANGHTAQFINPGEGFGLGPDWQDWTVLGPTQTDMAFRIEGEVLPLTDIPWMSESPLLGTVPPAACATVDVLLDSTGLAFGEYSADLVIVSDDPDTPQTIVPVSLTVQGYSVYLPIIYRVGLK